MAVSKLNTVSGDNWQLIQTNTISSPVSSSTFSSFSGYKKLRLYFSAVGVSTTGGIRYLRFNSDSTQANYAGGAMGPNTTYSRAAAGMVPLTVNSNQGAMYTFIEINNVDQSYPKTIDGVIGDPGDNYAADVKCVWDGAAITSIAITDSNGNNLSGGSIKLYGLA